MDRIQKERNNEKTSCYAYGGGWFFDFHGFCFFCGAPEQDDRSKQQS